MKSKNFLNYVFVAIMSLALCTMSCKKDDPEPPATNDNGGNNNGGNNNGGNNNGGNNNGGDVKDPLFVIGQSYQGGKIFYIDDSGEHGLIAAPSDESGTYQFSKAKKACEDKELDGYDDWFLPNKDELNKLYLNYRAVGGFSKEEYWSSSVQENGHYWIQNFSDGLQNTEVWGVAYHKVRAVREF